MRYICIVHADPEQSAGQGSEEQRELDQRCQAFNRELTEQVTFIVGEALEEPETAILVRSRNGTVSNTDGPYMETKEVMAGFILVEARDMNDAVRIAAGFPMAERGTIEVRPIYHIPTPPEKA